MQQIEKDILIGLRSMFELRMNYACTGNLLSQLSNDELVKRIHLELARYNYGNLIILIDDTLFTCPGYSLIYDRYDIRQFIFSERIFRSFDQFLEAVGISAYVLSSDIGDPEKEKYCAYFHKESRIRIQVMQKLLLKGKFSRVFLCVKKELQKDELGYYTNFKVEKLVQKEPIRSVYTGYNVHYYNHWLANASGSNDIDTMTDAYWNLD